MAEELMRMMVIGPADTRRQGTYEALVAPLVRAERDPDEDEAEFALRGLREFSEDPNHMVRTIEDEVPFAPELRELRRLVLDGANPGEALPPLIRAAFGNTAEELVQAADWEPTLRRLNDSVVAAKVVGAETAPMGELAELFQAMRLVASAASGCAATVEDGVSALHRSLLIPAEYSRRQTAPISLRTRNQQRSVLQEQVMAAAVEKAKALSAIRFRQDAIEAAFEDLCGLSNSDLATLCPEGQNETGERDHESLCAAWKSVAEGAISPNFALDLLRKSGPPTRLILNPSGVARLSAGTREILRERELDPERADLIEISAALTDERRRLQDAEAAELPPLARALTGSLGGAQVTYQSTASPLEIESPEALDKLHESVQNQWPNILTGTPPIAPGLFEDPPFTPSRLNPIGVGRLYVTRQQILRYEPGEVSHIENILAGEKRERTHTRRTRLEQYSVLEREKENEEERNLETTDRAELEREVERSVREQFDAKGGVKINASYGSVSLEVSGEVAYSRASEDSARSAQKLAREVTESARQQIRDRVLERKERRLIEEREEVNTHAIDGTKQDEHRSGIYQWLNKVYKAEVWDYGERLMYDLLVPEPAAGLIHAATASEKVPAGQPRRPDEIPYEVDELDPQKVHELIALYGITEELPEYPRDKIESVSFSGFGQGESSGGNAAESKKLVIPELHYPVFAWGHYKASPIQGEGRWASIGVTIGSIHASYTVPGLRNDATGPGFPLIFRFLPPGAEERSNPAGKSIDVGIAAVDHAAFVLTVTVLFRPHPEAIDGWKRSVYAAIRSAYEQRLQEWRDAQTVRQFDTGPGSDLLLGRNPALNREVERGELQRAAIEIMRNRPCNWDLMHDVVWPHPDAPIYFPSIKTGDLKRKSPEIRFLQQAFEWENLTYVLYPYFYGRPSQWVFKVFYEDADPRFLEFLRAGAARVQIPVRPGFEEAVDHYMMTGEPWLGEDEPTIGDDAYLALHDELRARLGGDRDEVHLEELDFEVVVPTSLVKVRPGDDLPEWEKVDGTWREKSATEE